MPTEQKAAVIAELADLFRQSSAAVITEYRGLTVAEISKLRRALGADATYAVTKNTLALIAAKQAGIEGLDDGLKGPTAIAFVTGDMVEAAKSLRAFAKDTPTLVVKGGVLEGRAIDATEVGKLADLEPRPVLLSKLAGAMKAPLSKAVYMAAAPLAQAARMFDALRLKLEEEGGQPAAEAPKAEAPATDAPATDAPEATEAPTAEATETTAPEVATGATETTAD